jgi:dipeptidyl aminopeptidase/acylaminoacyl peptidase
MLALSVTFAPGGALAQPEDAVQATLIPRDAIFGNPSRTQGRISPDGKMLSWLAPSHGVMNVWVAPASDLSAARVISADKKRGITFHAWAPDSKHVLYQQDTGGNENYHIYAVDVAAGSTRDLTPVKEGVRATIQGVSRFRPDVVLVGLNDRNPELFDLYEIDYATGERKLIAENPGFGAWVTDNVLKPRLAMKQGAGGGSTVFKPDGKGGWEEAFAISGDDFFNTNPIGFNRDNSILYWVDARGRDKAALVAMNMATGATKVLAQSDVADIGDVVQDPETLEVIAYEVNYLRGDWNPLDAEMKADLAFLEQRVKGDLDFTAASDDGTRIVVYSSAAEQPGTYWLYDRPAKTVTRLFDTRPELSKAPLQPMYPVAIAARDGLQLVSYLTLPAGSDQDGDGRPEARVPMLLWVHGGPWGRDEYGYDPVHQWLANRGYAVLSVNYRGSTGFGKAHVNKAIGEWSGKMHDDLIDAVDWAIKEGVAQPDKIAIGGGSYGGYATLVGLTFTPDRFACGVDIVGPSNLVTLMQSFPPYWRPLLEGTFYRHIGDPAKPEDRKRIMAQSPISRVAAIEAPLLIGQGGNDPRVNKAESDQIVNAMKEKGLPVTYINYPDEGHGFVRPENRLSFFAAMEGFLKQCLGGAAQPIGHAFDGSSAEVLAGAEYVKGLDAVKSANATGLKRQQ